MRTIAFSSCALCFCSPAFADFITLDIREDKVAPAPEIAAQIDPEGLGFRTFNFYAVFDGPGSANREDPGFLNRTFSGAAHGDGDPFGSAFGIRKESFFGAGDFNFNESAYFYQTPEPFGSDFRPKQGFIDIEPTLEWDTYVSVGKKTVVKNSESPVTGFPGFGFPDRDGDGRPDAISSGWGATDPTNQDIHATFNTDSGQFEVFLAQLSIIGLDAGARLGEQTTHGIFQSDIFSGEFLVGSQGDLLAGENPGLSSSFAFIPLDGPSDTMPSPSPMIAVMGFVGIASARRRRCS